MDMNPVMIATLQTELQQVREENERLKQHIVAMQQAASTMQQQANEWSVKMRQEEFEKWKNEYNQSIAKLNAEHEEKIRQMTAKLDESKAMFYEDKEHRVLNIPRNDKVVNKLVKEFTPVNITEGTFNRMVHRLETAKNEEQKAASNLAEAEKRMVWRTRRRIAFEAILEGISPELEETREVESAKKKIDRKIGQLQQQKRRLSISSTTNLSPLSKAFRSPKKKVQKKSATATPSATTAVPSTTEVAKQSVDSKQGTTPSSSAQKNTKSPVAKRIIDLSEDDADEMDLDENYDYTQDEEEDDE